MRDWHPTCAWVLVAAILTGPSHARTATSSERAACEAKIQQRIDHIDSRLRAGYSNREGERLKEQRRKLEEKRASCRVVDE